MNISKFPLKARAKCAYCNSTVYGYVQFVDELLPGYVWFKTSDGALVMVQEDSVCAFTGNKDNDGVDIYEGDVVETTFVDLEDGLLYKERFLVAFNEMHGAFCFFYTSGEFSGVGLYWLLYDNEFHVSVIGNVYDNEELAEIFDKPLKVDL